MGLEKCFEAKDCFDYLDTGVGAYGDYNQWLIAGSRHYSEEIIAATSSGIDRPGSLFVDNRSDGVINFVAACYTVYWPGWRSNWWKNDLSEGRRIIEVPHDATVLFDLIHVTPDDRLFWFGIHADAAHGGPVELNPTHLTVAGTYTFRITDYAPTAHAYDFGADFRNDRVWFRWSDNSKGQVSCYRISTKAKIADVYTPNETCGIMPTGDGFVYIADKAGWILLYDYNGAFRGAMRNPLKRDYNGGAAWGWDNRTKRLLFLPATPSASDGASTLKVSGFYPVPESVIVSPAIPREVPRKNRTIYFVGHLCGSGGEPKAARPADVGGDVPAQTLVSDANGDIVGLVKPLSAGQLTVELTVASEASVP